MSNKLWFKAKTYGIGWYPITWQGWIVTLVFVGLIILSSLLAERYTQKTSTFLIAYLSSIFLLVIILIIICWKKGEPLRWHWGE